MDDLDFENSWYHILFLFNSYLNALIFMCGDRNNKFVFNFQSNLTHRTEIIKEITYNLNQ